MDTSFDGTGNGGGSGGLGNGNGGGNGGGNRQKTGLPLLYDVWKSGLSSFTMSDTWNSPLARLAVPDKISFGLSQSATAYFGFNKGLFLSLLSEDTTQI